MGRRFFTLDVFTNRRFTGNPLAVVLDTDGLDAGRMQAIAREFNLAETVFVFPGEQGHRARLRIFTPAVELAFAGHPTVGTAVLLARLDGGKPGEFVLGEGIGPVRCRFEPREGGSGYALFDLPRLPEEAGAAADKAALAAGLGLDPDEIGEGELTAEKWSAGNPFTFVPVKGVAAVRKAKPQPAHWEQAFGGGTFAAAFVFTRETADAGNHFHARMFAPGVGVPEDPATGSAAAAFAGYAARHEGLVDGSHLLRIEQGYEMGRPSLIEVHLDLAGGRLLAAAIGGEAVVVSEGAIEA